ncbi:NAD(P)-binding domain protein [Akanthomyces lecanii RCEF 1005]|uniref:NAD(P)-binding domain protein n=1 Tax=Akanthomyces lecanii RCEF 1005 TaxID=1081108 RepID=A0A162KK03_CORDF|nr:NAD(P)-binding domain protein [Akanthomyces lecanii RCEF 1005]
MALISYLPIFLNSQFLEHPELPTTDCTGRTIIVTGANVGLGKEAARHFVRLNAAKVILACRTVSKGEAARADIEATTKRSGVVEVRPLDLESYDSIRKFVRWAETLDRVDVVLENAGVQATQFKLVNGYEIDISINVISTFLLGLLILPKLQESARKFAIRPTLTVVASDTHYFAPFSERKAENIFAEFNKSMPSAMGRYSTSKLLQIFVVREIAKRGKNPAPVDKLHVTVNCLTPGYCHSQLERDMSCRIVDISKKMIARTTEVGARTLVNASLQGPSSHGKYFQDCKVRKCASLVEGKVGLHLAARVWSELCAELEKIQPGVTAPVGLFLREKPSSISNTSP